MSIESVGRDRVMALIVQTFFKYFVTGLVESGSDMPVAERFEPRNIKQMMISYYEQVSRFFNREAFYAIMKMNFSTDEMERELRSFMTDGTTDMDLVRFACRTDALYDVMVCEYKRHFEQLLCGRIESQGETDKAYKRCEGTGEISVAAAEKLLSELAANAYAAGKNIPQNSRKD